MLSIRRSVTLLVAASFLSINAAFAAADPAEIVSAIEKAKILAADAAVKADITADETRISTFRHIKSNPKDCKIDAVLIAKAVMDLSPETTRVAVFFWDQDRRSYKRVIVTSGNVKAFASKQLNQDELLKSIPLEQIGGTPGEIAGNSPAAINSVDVINSIEKSQILPAGTAIKADVTGEEVRISTFRSVKDNPKDNKIDAIMIAKAVMDAAPSVARIPVYFWHQDLSNYNKVLVTAGDVKAFGSRVIGQDELLKSLVFEHVQNADSNTKLQNVLGEMESSKPLSRLQIVPKGDQIVVTTESPQWMPDRDAKFEAVRIAEQILNVSASGVKSISVSFVNPADKSTRQIVVDAGAVRQLGSAIDQALQSVTVQKTAGKLDVSSYHTVAGILKEQRESLLSRIRSLQSKGVGTGPFLKAFIDLIENHVKEGDEAKLTASINSLSASLDEQEKKYREAQEFKPQGGGVSGGTVTKAATNATPKRTSRWSGGADVIDEHEVMRGADSVAQRYSNSPTYASVLDHIAAILKQNNKPADAARYERMANDARARGSR